MKGLRALVLCQGLGGCSDEVCSQTHTVGTQRGIMHVVVLYLGPETM